MKPQPAKGQMRIRAGRDLVEEEEVQPDEDQNRHHEEREPALKLGHSHAPQQHSSVAAGRRRSIWNTSGIPPSTAGAGLADVWFIPSQNHGQQDQFCTNEEESKCGDLQASILL